MKKICFSDKFGLTDAVLQGRKTMTRRLVGDRMTEYDIKAYLKGYTEMADMCAQYKIGEVVAIAQAYKDAGIDPHFLMFQPIKGSKYLARNEIEAMFTGGWNNKASVRADLMPHQIRITDIKVERLQDISEEDCLKEGVRTDDRHWVKTYKVDNLWNKRDRQMCWYTARGMYSALIDKILGNGTWLSNPYVFAYTFELV